MKLENVYRLYHEKSLVGYRFEISEEGGKSLFDVDKDDFIQLYGSSIPKIQVNGNLELVLYNGMLMSRMEQSGKLVVGDLCGNIQAQNFVLGVLRGEIGNTVGNDISNAFDGGIKRTDISNDVLVNPDSYNYKGLEIGDIVADFISYSGADGDGISSYELHSVYYEPARELWYCYMMLNIVDKDGQESCVPKVYVMKYGTREEAVAKLSKYEGKKTTKQNAKVLKEILKCVKDGSSVIAIQFKCNWSGLEAFEKFNNGIKSKVLVWQA